MKCGREAKSFEPVQTLVFQVLSCWKEENYETSQEEVKQLLFGKKEAYTEINYVLWTVSKTATPATEFSAITAITRIQTAIGSFHEHA